MKKHFSDVVIASFPHRVRHLMSDTGGVRLGRGQGMGQRPINGGLGLRA